MQALILFLAVLTQDPTSPPAPDLPPPPTAPVPDSPPAVTPVQKSTPQQQPPAPTKMPPIPGKTLPVPQAPAKVQPPAQPPAKTLPVPQAPAKLQPQEQRPPAAQAQTTSQEVLGPDQQVWINQYGCYCVGQQIVQGPPDLIGKWRVKYKVSTPQGNYTYTAQGYGAQSYAAYGQAGSFLAWLNSTRAQYGLPAVGYDSNLEAWAHQNNAQQAARGIGHFVMGPARRQNSAMSGGDPSGMWMNSPGHRSALLDPSIRAIGLAFNGQYWTFNAY